MDQATFVSIHAPARGATLSRIASPVAWAMFQSTPPRGGRHLLLARLCRWCAVSIHAPARGATRIAAGLRES